MGNYIFTSPANHENNTNNVNSSSSSSTSTSTSTKFSSLTSSDNVDDIDDEENVAYDFLKDYTKEQLIEYVKGFVVKNLNLPSDATERMKNIELENTTLIPMCIELYQKLLLELGEYKPPADKKTSKKKMFFVRPKFDVSEVNKALEVSVKRDVKPFDEKLMAMQVPKTVMKMTDITIEEFSDSFNNTLTKKDMLGISKGLLRDMPHYLKVRFVNTFNKILADVTLVNKHSFGKGSYIYKAGKKGPRENVSSFRMVLSIPNAVNQFHRILALRLNDYLIVNKYMDTTIQKGGVSGQSFAIFEQFYKIKNVLKHANKNKKSCCMMFLDITNAYGSLHLPTLQKVLSLYSVDKKFNDYVKQFYENFQYYVTVSQQKTDTFKWEDGLIQGCSLSALLFVLALNYVLTYMDKEYKNTHGYALNDTTNILFTAYMDDICIICKDVASMEIVYKKLIELLSTLGLFRNLDKCAVMVVNDTNKFTPESELSKLTPVTTFKYLGETISSDGSVTESYKQFLKMITRKLISIDRKTCSNQDKLDIFTTCVSPWILRRTMAMYDIDKNTRLKIVSLIKPYLEKWDHQGDINLFSNVSTIVNTSTDEIIKTVEFNEDEFDTDLADDIDVANYVLKDAHLHISYSEIDGDFKLDLKDGENEDDDNDNVLDV